MPARRATDMVTVYTGTDTARVDSLLELKESTIARIGGFAAQDLVKGQELGVYSGEILTSVEDVNARLEEYTRGEVGWYIFQLPSRKRMWVDAAMARCDV